MVKIISLKSSKTNILLILLLIWAFLLIFLFLLIFTNLSLGYVLSMFLYFWKFEPQRSYKHGSYSKKSVYQQIFIDTHSFKRSRLVAVHCWEGLGLVAAWRPYAPCTVSAWLSVSTVQPLSPQFLYFPLPRSTIAMHH